MVLCRILYLTDIISLRLKVLLCFSQINCHCFSWFYVLWKILVWKMFYTFEKHLEYRILSWHVFVTKFFICTVKNTLNPTQWNCSIYVHASLRNHFSSQIVFLFFWVLVQVCIYSVKYLMTQRWRFLDSLCFFISGILPTEF